MIVRARSEPLDLALLEHAQHLGLGLRAHVADFVEEDRAAVGLLELADLLLGGAGERAFLVTEQLRLDQLLRNRRAVHLHEALAAAQAVAVNRPRDQLLADAALALKISTVALVGAARPTAAITCFSPRLSPII